MRRAYLLGCFMLLVLAGCRNPHDAQPQAPAPAPGLTLLERQILEAIVLEQQLDAIAAAPDADEADVQRHFHQVDQRYSSIVVSNPRSLEARLLYGKLLSRYGDTEGAREQFLMAAKIDPAVAVIHQQLSTYYAEEGDFTRALAYALNAVRLEPRTAAYQYGLGQVLAGFRSEFIAEKIFPPEQLDADMLAAFRMAKDLAPDNLDLQFRYGEAFYDVAQPDWDAALAHWRQLANRNDLSPLQQDAVRLHQARCLLGLGRDPEARALTAPLQAPGN